MDNKLREELAQYSHDAWSGWMKYMFDQGVFEQRPVVSGMKMVWTMPAWAVERWTRQMQTPYENLPEEEKASDRIEADRILAVIASHNNDMR